MARRSRPMRDRRGVLILVVLSLLTLFVLIAVAYVVVTNVALISSKAANRAERYRPEPRTLLNSALLQLLVDTENINSSMLGHGLLNDMYGPPTAVGQLSSNGTLISSTGNQFLDLTLDKNVADLHGNVSGRVLTMLDGPLKGMSTRIVYTPAPNRVRVMAFPRSNAAGSAVEYPRSGNTYLINGPAFAGTGYGLDPNTGRVNRTDGDGPLALQPHMSARAVTTNGGWQNVPGKEGWFNESYDAADYQNMFLTMIGAEPANNNVFPAFHRPDLIRYWAAKKAGGPADWAGLPRQLLRKIMLRPLPQDHSPSANDNGDRIDFTGKRFDPINGPFDVDTDGDGFAESIWVDLGFPVLTARDGRPYKPLFAIQCVDMGGKGNLNAHSSMAQTDNGLYDPGRGHFARPGGGGETARQDPPPVGRGGGPAEVNLQPILDRGTNGQSRFQRLMDGTGMARGRGRYGADRVPGIAGNDKLSRIRQYRGAGRFRGAKVCLRQPTRHPRADANRIGSLGSTTVLLWGAVDPRCFGRRPVRTRPQLARLARHDAGRRGRFAVHAGRIGGRPAPLRQGRITIAPTADGPFAIRYGG